MKEVNDYLELAEQAAAQQTNRAISAELAKAYTGMALVAFLRDDAVKNRRQRQRPA